MENLSLDKYEKEGLVIEKDRVLTYSNIICPLNCRYCFVEKLSGAQNKSVVYLSEKQLALLEKLPSEIKTIMLGCDTELFQNKNEAVEILKKLSVIGKDISVITKLSLGDDLIENIAGISNDMIKRGNMIVFSESIPCYESSQKWEPRAPKVEKRVDTLRRISETGINCMVAIRPLIPNIQESEIDKIIDLSNQYVFGYYSGPLYIKDFINDVLSKEESQDLKLKVEGASPDWMPKGNKFLKIENPKLMAYLQEKVKNTGKEYFEGAAQGIEFLRKNRNV